MEIESNDLYPALNRKLPIQHGSGTKKLTGKKELNRRDDYSLQLLVIVMDVTRFVESENLIEDATVYEDSWWLPSYESVITLLTIPERIELRAEYDDEDEEPLDPSDFTVYRRRWPR